MESILDSPGTKAVYEVRRKLAVNSTARKQVGQRLIPTMLSHFLLPRMISFMQVLKLSLRLPNLNLHGAWIELISEIFHWTTSTTMMPLEKELLSLWPIVVLGLLIKSLQVDLLAAVIILAKGVIVLVVTEPMLVRMVLSS